MSSLKSATIISVIWKLVEKGGSQVVSLIVQIVLARLLSPGDYGALAVMVVFLNIANVFVQSGFATSLIQARELDSEALSSVFWLTLSIAAALYGAIWFAAPFIAAFYDLPVISSALRVLTLSILIGTLTSIYTAMVSREMQFKRFFYATIASVVSSGMVGVTMALLGIGLWALVGQHLVSAIVNCLVLGLQVRWLPSFEFSSSKVIPLFSFGWKLLVSGILEVGYQSLSDLLIGKQFSTSNLGLVSQGKKIPMTLGNLLDGSIQPVMLSAVSHAQDDRVYVKRLVRRALKTSTFLIMPAMTLFGVAAGPIVSLLFGEKWIACVPFFQMYCFIYALLPIHTTNLQALNGMGRSDLFLKLELVKKIYGVCFILFAAFVLKDVYLMVAMYMLSGIISTFVNAWPNKRVIGYAYGEQLRDIAPAFLLSAASGFLTWCVVFIGLGDAATILLQVVVMVTAYLGFARLLHVEELDYLLFTAQQMLKKRKGGSFEE